ncbi:hypothetical protein F5Y05DRAFT_296782 [Hypoxylon sp. FL0543]|nr:hypothetical protein F5Y05DRAFT_296782 [Hypoxylon sp. FL0543]
MAFRRPLRPTAYSSPSPRNLPGGTGTSGISAKHVIWTGAFAAVTIVGAIYGAGLKTQQEYKQEKQKILETSPEERIRGLEERRAMLVRERAPLERKLEELRARIRAQEIKDAAAAAAGDTAAAGDGSKK